MVIKTELRGDCPKDTVDVLDAISHAREISRTDLVNQILGEWCADRVHEASLINRVSRGNPTLADLLGVSAEVVAEKRDLIRRAYQQ